MTLFSKPLRSIRSFVRREGNITPGQERALKELWPLYGIEPGDTPFDFVAVFGRDAPVILEIGFGNGEALAEEAEAHPENNYLGIEVHRPGAGILLRRIESSGLKNVRLLLADAQDILSARIPEASLAGVRLFFPDPWPKKRHNKRRLVQPEFAGLIVRQLRAGGYFHLATDWPDYADHMVAVLSATPELIDVSGQTPFTDMVAARAQTRFERRGLDQGNPIRDLVYQRRP
jgi:tRNA (guanine-N7-)-methyltransferase